MKLILFATTALPMALGLSACQISTGGSAQVGVQTGAVSPTLRDERGIRRFANKIANVMPKQALPKGQMIHV
ncbi:hypothetical protein Q5Y75_00245 [Ruegeria sp. 2205SS24-7]|uniref:hypothetical protein n=1 Tax=Ruegeria discodermiae TaxID=3064389 RepID=UPI002741948C|nr:hypothetical protein [Ruegeria sp. 2205SS24-7]MDP5215637.1 hypothetical protein [Ruegeria sp. 2205SS24-7]